MPPKGKSTEKESELELLEAGVEPHAVTCFFLAGEGCKCFNIRLDGGGSGCMTVNVPKIIDLFT